MMLALAPHLVEMDRSATFDSTLRRHATDYPVLGNGIAARLGWQTQDLNPTGAIGNAEHQNIVLGKAGRSRHKGKRPQTRGTAMNPVDHPHGGGEGSTTAGRHPVTPWGVPTLGYRTRKKQKQSDRYIVRGRRRGKKGGR